MKRLEHDEVRDRLPDAWMISDNGCALRRSFGFKDFIEAFGFMTKVAMVAEKFDHHPEWSNVYNRVDIRWTTHDVDGLIVLDLELAEQCNQFFDHLCSLGGKQ
jgi:4a-hydroxytetrahydrobiopterin dehydratase